MKISYAITVCNEREEIERLLQILHRTKRTEDEICVLVDKPKADVFMLDTLYYWASKDIILLKESTFQGNFAEWKNELNRMCTGDFIFNIDADEYPSGELLKILPWILEENQNVDVYSVPRINTVDGLTKEHIQKWGWRVNDNGYVNWPDYQMRIYRNIPSIKWEKPVHEQLNGYLTYNILPAIEEYCLHHPKTIDRQERQNNFYDTF
jgi:hypothetical protein